MPSLMPFAAQSDMNVRDLARVKRRPQFRAGELLESRNMLSALFAIESSNVTSESALNDTLQQAQDLGTFGSDLPLDITGSIDSDGVDVDWYRFSLAQPSIVHLTVSAGTMGLYDNAAADYSDQLNPTGHRLLTQVSTTDGNSEEISRQLGAGTYFIAVSGTGNRYFSPLIADSGLAGEPGDYTLELRSARLDLNAVAAPVVLAIDVTSMAARIDFSAPFDFDPIVTMTDSNGSEVLVASSNFSSDLAELRIFPNVPFAGRHYQAVLADMDGNTRMTIPIDVSPDILGEHGDLGDDTPATATDLGNVEQQGLLQITGTIGDDPFYYLPGDSWISPGNDVDLYHFVVTSTQPIGLQAEVFAGRIGSSLDAGLSLFRRDLETGHLQFVAGNNNTFNPTVAEGGVSPLYFDSALSAGLTAGDYYLAVSQGSNTVSPMEGQFGGTDSGIFDPEQPHSGSAGWSVGPYVVNLRTIPVEGQPEVTTVSIADQSLLTSAPTSLTVQFSEYMDLTGLAMYAFQQTSKSSVAGISIQNDQGQQYFPRLVSFDTATMTAQFMMLDRLPAGTYTLRLDGSQGLTNLIGAPLTGNRPDGTYTVNFKVGTLSNKPETDPLVRMNSGDDSISAPQDLGVLFPSELVTGVNIHRSTTTGNAQHRDTSDFYQFQLLQTQAYNFHVSSENLPADSKLEVFDLEGHLVVAAPPEDPWTLLAILPAGDYVLGLSSWAPSAARRLDYQINVKLIGGSDNPPPLYSGPAPAVSLRLAGDFNDSSSSNLFGSSNLFSNSSILFVGNPGINGNPGSSSSIRKSNGASQESIVSKVDGLYYLDRPGVSLTSIAGVSDGTVIAISNYQSRSMGSGIARLASRTSRRNDEGSNRLSLPSLSGIADGPMGKSNEQAEDVGPTLHTMHRMHSLIESAFSSTAKDEIADRISNVPKSPDTDIEAELSNEVTVAQPPVGEHGNPDDDSGSEDPTPKAEDFKRQERARSVTMWNKAYHVQDGTSRDRNEPAFVLVDDVPASFSLQDGLRFERNDSKFTIAVDTMFAAGMGFLLLQPSSTDPKQDRRIRSGRPDGLGESIRSTLT